MKSKKNKILVIVESPTKAKTIGKFISGNYLVESSYGHLRDLPKSKLGIDVEHDFEPHYIIPLKAKSRVSLLKKEAAKASEVILATDEDREGESIAWHLVQALGLNHRSQQPKQTRMSRSGSKNSDHSDAFVGSDRIKRIVFHEITKSAIEHALESPREIDLNLVNAQQARRVVDRLVGYKLSPFLWKKIARGLSAGRVQSVALRLIVEREEEIKSFTPQEYWSIEAIFTSPEHAGKKVEASLWKKEGKVQGKFDINKEDEAKKIASDLEKSEYKIVKVETKTSNRNPLPPFTTSTLQQTAAARLGFSSKKTMFLAQGLYEKGFITYMRTDSLNLSSEALASAAAWIKGNLPTPYHLPQPRHFKTNSRMAQEAHEAIRPTDPHRHPQELKGEKDENRIYDLIWRRFMASQLPAAEFNSTKAEIAAIEKNISGEPVEPPPYTLAATGTTTRFDGFLKLWPVKLEERELPPLKETDHLNLESVAPAQHFTEPPARYSEATLIKALEKFGIGRPSTYAPTLSVIQTRNYVEKIEKRFHPTEIGVLVNKVLTEHFPKIVDIQFTADMEGKLDTIAEGKAQWQKVVREFYDPFASNLAQKEKEVEQQVQESAIPCPHCGDRMIVKFGRFGKFLACPDPESKITLPMPEEQVKIKELEEKTKGELCPLCRKPLAVKRGRFGFFLGCVDYPTCKGIAKIWNKTGFKCPNCPHLPPLPEGRLGGVGEVVEKRGRGRGKPFWACTRYPDCTFVINKKPESEDELQTLYTHWRENPPKPRAKKAPPLSSPRKRGSRTQ